MYQKLIATTTLGELVGVGERFSEGTHSKPGKYNVYALSKTEDDYDTAVLFIHETESQCATTLAYNGRSSQTQWLHIWNFDNER